MIKLDIIRDAMGSLASLESSLDFIREDTLEYGDLRVDEEYDVDSILIEMLESVEDLNHKLESLAKRLEKIS